MTHPTPTPTGASLLIDALLAQGVTSVFCVPGKSFLAAIPEPVEPPAEGTAIDLVQSWGLLRMHQEKHFPQHVYGTALHNPDFAALAQAFGAHGLRVDTAQALVDAVLQGFKADRPTLIHVRTDPEQVSAGATLSGIRTRALAQGH